MKILKLLYITGDPMVYKFLFLFMLAQFGAGKAAAKDFHSLNLSGAVTNISNHWTKEVPAPNFTGIGGGIMSIKETIPNNIFGSAKIHYLGFGTIKGFADKETTAINNKDKKTPILNGGFLQYSYYPLVGTAFKTSYSLLDIVGGIINQNIQFPGIFLGIGVDTVVSGSIKKKTNTSPQKKYGDISIGPSAIAGTHLNLHRINFLFGGSASNRYQSSSRNFEINYTLFVSLGFIYRKD